MITQVDHEARLKHHAERIAALGLQSDGKSAASLFKPVVLNGTRYASAQEASRMTGIHEKTIREVCCGYRATNRFKAYYEDEA